MYAVVLVLMSLSGEASYVTGYYVGQGVPEAAARVLVLYAWRCLLPGIWEHLTLMNLRNSLWLECC